MGFRVIEFASTPNPNALKIVLDSVISEKPISFFNSAAGAEHPLARQLFEVPGVASVLILTDFITINKTADAKWKPIRTAVGKILASYEPA